MRPAVSRVQSRPNRGSASRVRVRRTTARFTDWRSAVRSPTLIVRDRTPDRSDRLAEAQLTRCARPRASASLTSAWNLISASAARRSCSRPSTSCCLPSSSCCRPSASCCLPNSSCCSPSAAAALVSLRPDEGRSEPAERPMRLACCRALPGGCQAPPSERQVVVVVRRFVPRGGGYRRRG